MINNAAAFESGTSPLVNNRKIKVVGRIYQGMYIPPRLYNSSQED
jgi:hypothetical protein